MTEYFTSTSSKWSAGLCWLQVAVATAAALTTLVDVELTIGFGPLLALFGFVIALFSVGRSSLNLLCFGLLGPVTTSLIALCIAFFRWSPSQAANPVLVILMLNAGVTCVWGVMTARQIARSNSMRTPADKPKFQFSLLSMVVLLTFTSILLAIFRKLTVFGVMGWFTVYGISVLVLSVVISVWYWMRFDPAVLEDGDANTSVLPDAIIQSPTRHGHKAESRSP
jgi:hypothetical protein